MWPRKLVNQERNSRQLLYGPEMMLVWLTDLGKISNFSPGNVLRADNNNMAAVLQFCLALANNGA
jgi:hypothetical protein